MVRELSELDEQAGGFDFRFVPGSSPRTLEIVAPKLGDPASPVFTLEVDVVTQLANMDEVEFDNAGPTASHVLGVGAGTAQRQGGVNKHFPAVSARYRRRDRIADFGDVKNLLALEALTTAELVVDANPLHEIPITVNPAAIPNFWNITYPGVYIMVDYDLGWHHIESVQRIVEMDCTVSTEGEERVSLGLNQFYDQTLTSATSVVTDW
jgi:hypothetical protein